MKSLLLIFAIQTTFSVYSQKIKIDDNIAYVDGIAWVKYEKKNMANEASVMGLESQSEEIFILYQNYADPNNISKANPEGKVRWLEINFLTLGIKCEIANETHKGVVKLLADNKIYKDGVLNAENAALLVKKYGTRFSDNRLRNGNVNIIIQN
ncbi:MAG: hypothetical protein RL679_1778 [Bacteroidota bacterium]|jgi:hypothetical protein